MKLSKPVVAAVMLLLAFGSFAATNLVVSGGLFGKSQSSGGGGGGAGDGSSGSTGKSVYQLLRIAAGLSPDVNNGVGTGNHVDSRITSAAGPSAQMEPGPSIPSNTKPAPKNDVSFNEGRIADAALRDLPPTSGSLGGLHNSEGGSTGFSAPSVSPIYSSGPAAPVATTGLDKTTVTTLPTVTAVPEPETYAMLLAGLVLIGAIGYRRSQAKSAYMIVASCPSTTSTCRSSGTN